MKTLLVLVALAAVVFVALGIWRTRDLKDERGTWASLAARQPSDPRKFDPGMISDLPEPAQRFFRFAIHPGAPLYTVAQISMEGEFSLGNKARPNYMPMHAEQLLAAPHGFVWRVRVGKVISVAGSDGAENGRSWSRFWLFGIVPVGRAGNNKDHARSAFGRYVAEAVFWTPAALLPGRNVRWEAIDNSVARVVVTHMGMEQAVDISVNADGRLSKVVFQRWSNANPLKKFQPQPFGGYLSEYREFDGFRLPTRVDAGNYFGTDDYFPFFRATITSVRFPAHGGD